MRYYSFGNPEGRFIGNTEKYSVFERTISEKRIEMPVDRYRNLPGEFTFAYGPATGGLLESVAFDIHTPGELVKHIEVNPYFKTRNLKITGLNPRDALMIIERINGFHSASNSVAFEMAVEDALGIEVSSGVLYSRMMMLELERIRSNLEVIKRLAEPAGFGVPQNQISYLREKTARIISKISGHRYFFSATFIGGCEIQTEGIEAEIEAIKIEFSDIFDSLLQSKIFLNRLQNNGNVKDGNLLGPAARAAGMNVDARLENVILPYSEIGFRPFIFNEPDSFGRFYVRGQEILDSCDMILRISGNSENSSPVDTMNESGEGSARVESPQGDLFYYVKLADGKIEDLQISSPSLLNIDAFRRSMAGNIFTDYHFNWESYGIWISELAVVVR